MSYGQRRVRLQPPTRAAGMPYRRAFKGICSLKVRATLAVIGYTRTLKEDADAGR